MEAHREDTNDHIRELLFEIVIHAEATQPWHEVALDALRDEGVQVLVVAEVKFDRVEVSGAIDIPISAAAELARAAHEIDP